MVSTSGRSRRCQNEHLKAFECHAVLWDFAGQRDYRLIHSVFLDDVHIAILLFSAPDRDDPVRGVRFWVRALAKSVALNAMVLVATQTDVGHVSMNYDKITQFCIEAGIKGGFVATSAKTGEGVATLGHKLKALINWSAIPTTVSTFAFGCAKEIILEAKAGLRVSGAPLLDVAEIRLRMIQRWKKSTFTKDEVTTALKHLENHGIVTNVYSSSRRQLVLLAPELPVNLAASITLLARNNARGLGSIRENEVFSDFSAPELARLSREDIRELIETAIAMFLQRNLCFREIIGSDQLLIFPSLIHGPVPILTQTAVLEVGCSYSLSGDVDQIFAMVVVLLGYTNTFKNVSFWKNFARFTFSSGHIVGLRMVPRDDGRAVVTVCFGGETPDRNRQLFQSLLEVFLFERGADIRKIVRPRCDCGYQLSVEELERRQAEGRTVTFCVDCGQRLRLDQDGILPMPDDIRRSPSLGPQRKRARGKTLFESALARLRSYLRTNGVSSAPCCFVSYAWGKSEHEDWVATLVGDLEDAGISVIFDRKDNSDVGKSIARFVADGIQRSDYAIVVGTPSYLKKYYNQITSMGSAVAAEMDLINLRLMGTESAKKSVLPVLLDGSPEESLPPLLLGRVRADFRDDSHYFSALLDLVVTINSSAIESGAAMNLRNNLQAALGELRVRDRGEGQPRYEHST